MTDSLKDLPRWALIGLAVIGILAVGAIATWAGAALQAATDKNADQDRTLDNHALRIEWQERMSTRIDAKLEKLIEGQRQ